MADHRGAPVLDLLKLIPEATSAIAVIIVVILFLRQQEAASQALKGVTQDFTTALESQRKAVIDFMHQHLEAVSNMVTAVRTLEATAQHTNALVLELQHVISQHYGTHQEGPGAPGKS
jgi:hypothetical protein